MNTFLVIEETQLLDPAQEVSGSYLKNIEEFHSLGENSRIGILFLSLM